MHCHLLFKIRYFSNCIDPTYMFLIQHLITCAEVQIIKILVWAAQGMAKLTHKAQTALLQPFKYVFYS